MAGWRLLLLAMVLLPAVSTGLVPARAGEDAGPAGREGLEFFEKSVRPVLVERCWTCHGGPSPKGKSQDQGWPEPDHPRRPARRGRQRAVGGGGESRGQPASSAPSATTTSRGCRRRSGSARSRSSDLTRWVELGLPWPSAGRTEPAGGAVATPVASPPAPPSGDRGRDHWAFRPVADPPVPAGPRHRLAPVADRPVRPGRDGASRPDPRPGRRQADVDPPRDLRPDRPAPHAGRGRGLPRRRPPRGLRPRRRPAAGLPALRRALGPALARPGPVRRHRRRDRRLPRPRGLPLPQLRDRRLQRRPALRPVPPRADRRRPGWRTRTRLAATRGSSPPASWPSPAASASTRRTTTT